LVGRIVLAVLISLVLAGAGLGAAPAAQVLFATDLGAPGNTQIAVMRADGSGLRLLTHHSPRADVAAISPDGSRIVFSTRGALWTARADGSGAKPLLPVGAGPALWSPDGKQIAFTSDGLEVVNSDGSGLHRVLRTGPRLFMWSPDGSQFAFSPCGNGCGVALCAADGTYVRRLAKAAVITGLSWVGRTRIAYEIDSGLSVSLEIRAVGVDGRGNHRVATGFRSPVGSPDGRRIAMIGQGRHGQIGIWVAPARGGAPHQVAAVPGRGEELAWSGDGSAVVFASRYGDHPARAYVARLPHGPALPLSSATQPATVLGSPEWAADGSAVIVGRDDGTTHLELLRASGGRSPLLQAAADIAPRASPDGRRIAFVRTSYFGKHPHVLLMNRDGSGVRDLGLGYAIRWSSTGSLGFIAGDDAEGDLTVVDSDGTIRRPGIVALSFAWSPDATEIAYSAKGVLWRIRAGTPPRPLFKLHPRRVSCGHEPDFGPAAIFNVQWSPDGRTIAFADGFECGDSQLRLIGADGSHMRLLIDGSAAVETVSWSHDGAQMVYAGLLARADGSDPRPLAASFPIALDECYSWSPDDSQLLCGNAESIWVLSLKGDPPGRIGPPAIVDAQPIENAYPSWSP
jgi:Tol biopolymer transport system component